MNTETLRTPKETAEVVEKTIAEIRNGLAKSILELFWDGKKKQSTNLSTFRRDKLKPKTQNLRQ